MTILFGRTTLAFLCFAFLGICGSAHASLLAYDGFDYPAGSLIGKTGPVGFNAAYTAFGTGSTVSSPGSVYPGLTVVGNKVDLSGTGNGAVGILTNSPETPGTTIYFSYLMQCGNGASYAGISLFQGATETLYTGSRGNFIGVDPKGGTAANSASAVTPLTFVVCRVDFSASGATIRLYINPTSPAEPVYARVTVTKTTPLAYDRIRIASSGVTGSVDEFRMGTTYADVVPVTRGASPERIVVMGSSVAFGYGADPQSAAWAYRFKDLMENHAPVVPGSAVKWQVGNASVGGDNTTKVLARFQTDLVNTYPDGDIVIIALSLANEGLVGADDPTAAAVYASFKNGLAQIVAQCRQKGYYPLISLVYPNDNYTASQYALVRKMNLLLNTWDLPSINFLGGTDGGTGHWAPGCVFDAYHPNNVGHGEMFDTVVPSLFDAIEAGKTAGPRMQGTNSYLRLQRDSAQAAPIQFTPLQTMHAFTLSFRVRSTDVGTIAAVGAGANRATLEIRDDTLVYIGPGGAVFSTPLDANNGRWYDIALSHRYATAQTLLFVDGILKGTISDQYIPDLFVIGGAAGASGRAPAPLQADFQDVCIYRAAWTQDEALAQSTGALQQGSLEICAPLADAAPAQGAALENRAQSLSVLTLQTASFTEVTATPPDQLIAESFAATTASLVWTGHGYGANGFTIERRRTGISEAWITVGTSPGTSPNFEDTGLVAGQSYDYRVSAQEGAVQGEYSNVISILPAGQSALSYQDWITRYFVNDTSTYLIDFNTNASPDYNGVKWNTVNSLTSATPYSLVDTNNNSIGYTLTLADGFDQFRTDGVASLADFPSAPQTTMFALRDDVPLSASIRFGGLVPTATYNISFLARRGALVSGYDYTGTYTFTGNGAPVVVVVDAATNTALTKVAGLVPSASGTITLKITAGPGTGSDFPVINFLQLTRADTDQIYQQKINPSSDPDGDGLTNFEEYARGLDPTVIDNAKKLGFDSADLIDGSDMEFNFTINRRARDVNYVFEKSTDLRTWTVDPDATLTVLNLAGALKTIAYHSPANQPCLFYRIRMN